MEYQLFNRSVDFACHGRLIWVDLKRKPSKNELEGVFTIELVNPNHALVKV